MESAKGCRSIISLSRAFIDLPMSSDIESILNTKLFYLTIFLYHNNVAVNCAQTFVFFSCGCFFSEEAGKNTKFHLHLCHYSCSLRKPPYSNSTADLFKVIMSNCFSFANEKLRSFHVFPSDRYASSWGNTLRPACFQISHCHLLLYVGYTFPSGWEERCPFVETLLAFHLTFCVFFLFNW